MSPLLAHGLRHTGRRARSEDAHLIREDLGLVIVADGSSGAAGDLAARLAVDAVAGCFGVTEDHTLPSFEPEELADGLTTATVRFAIERAHERLHYEARRTGPPGMSTAVAVLVLAGPRVVVGHAGCARAYRLRGDTLDRLTIDTPLASPATCPVGAPNREIRPAVRADIWKPGDLYLLCTAGLHRVLGPEEIRCTLALRTSAADAATELVGRALHAGAADDMTVVVATPNTGRRSAATRQEQVEPNRVG